MTANSLHHALLRPAVIHILRAAGFHGARPSVVDTLTDLAGRYITLLSERTLAHSLASHNDLNCDITDLRMALEDCGLLVPTRTSSEEIWAELLRTPLEEYSEQYDIRQREKERRDDEDTEGVRNFAEWFESNKYREIQRIAGYGPPDGQVPSLGPPPVREDYLTVLKKKHSKTGEESRFQGSLLGKEPENHRIVIDGGPKTIRDWQLMVKEKASKAASAQYSPDQPPHDSQDTVMTI